MERLVTVLAVCVALVVGILIGQAGKPPTVTVTPSVASAASTASSLDTDKLTPYQRGQLAVDCYRIQLQDGRASNVVNVCLDYVKSLP